MIASAAQQIVILGAFLAVPPVEWPPEPNFEKPVDYFSWYEGWVADADGFAANAYADYVLTCPELKDFDPTKPATDLPWVFPNIAGPMADKYGDPVAWSLGTNPRWTTASATNSKCMDAFARAVRKPFVLVPTALLPNADRLGLDAHMFTGVGIAGPLIRARWAFLHAMWCRDGDYVDESRFVEHVETLLELARQLDRGGDGVSALQTFVRLRGEVIRSIEAALGMGILGRDSRAKLLQTLARLRPKDDRCRSQAIYDCALAYDGLQRLASARRTGNDVERAKIASDLLKTGYDEPRLARELREYFERILPLTSLPMEHAKLDKLADIYRELRSRPFFEHHEVVDPTTGLRLIARAAMQYDGVRILVALLVYRDVNHEWPESLDVLAKSKLIDTTIDPLNGKPFVYRIESGEPLLYSIGADAKDEGGTHDRRAGLAHDEPIQPGDYVIWPLERRGEE